jgi:hydrogenase expression/formation protein HypE
MAILSQREGLTFSAPIVSDTAALHGLVAAMLDSGTQLRVLRDPTRGGLATTLNEIAKQSGVGMLLQESAIAVKQPVAAACEFLGLDPLYVANEGKLIAICAAEDAQRLLDAMRAHPLAGEAAVIGEVGRTRADDHPVGRPPRGGLAGGRAAAADMLMSGSPGRMSGGYPPASSVIDCAWIRSRIALMENVS